MGRKLNNVISVLHSTIRFGLFKMIRPHCLHISGIQRFSPNVVIEADRGSQLTIGRKVRVHSGAKIKIRSGAKLTIQEDVMMNYNAIIVCRDSISIGAGTEFGPNVLIYDHDHDYRAGLKNDLYKVSPVTIGKNCWIGANSVILRGTVLGDNCVVGAGSVIKGTFPDGSVIIQKRELI